MNKLVKRYLWLNVLVLGWQGLAAQGLLDELQQLYQIDRLSEYLENGLVEQFSSYDRTGNNDDGFAGTYSFIRKEGGKQVIAEMKGPGVINRIWTPTPSSDTILFFFDGEETPRISLPFEELFTSNSFPFIDPVCGHEVGGYYCYLPIPYSKSCKVVFQGKMLFYQLQYRTYPENAMVRTFSTEWNAKEKAALENVAGLWRRYGTNYLNELYKNIQVKSTLVRIRPGEKKPVFEMNGGGRIIGLEVEGINKMNRLNNRLVLRAKWDHEEDWAINAPLKDFFGYFFGEKSMRSLLSGTSGNVSYFYYPMPFAKSVILEFEYLSLDEFHSGDLELSVRIFNTEKPKKKNEGKLYAHWRREINPPEGVPYAIMPQLYGKGHYVGTILSCQGMLPGSTGYFEGDDQVTIDGKLRLHGTGSEDYFNGGWYEIPDRWDMAHSLPSHGCLGYASALSRTGAYRHYFTDKLNFMNDFRLTIEHGPSGNKFPVDYRSVAFYYAEEALPQEPPNVMMTVYPGPGIVKYRAFLLKTLTFRNGKLVNGQRVGREKVLIFEPAGNKEPMLAKFELKAPTDGKYKLYSSYFRTPSSGQIRFMQRQVALTDWKNIYHEEEEYINKEFIGVVNVIDGICTITIHVRGKENNRFILHQLLLEKK